MEDKDLYTYYTEGGINSGLTFNSTDFFLNEKAFKIFSGSLHYFRFHPKSWKECIQKMRYCHLNTVCTYIPWNLHEDQPGEFNFNDFNLDLIAFIKLVREENMFLILRVGPYICAEIDFGGLPSWLLKDQNMKLRTHYPLYLNYVKKYFTQLISLIHDYQFSVFGGPIIAVQIENEFGSYGDTQIKDKDHKYMTYLRDTLIELGIKELLFTCDMPSVSFHKGSVPEVLMTANFQTDAEKELELLKELQPNKPLMVAELWSGWFDHWGDNHEEISVDVYMESLKVILNKNASFNIYVFQGGTNFGFSNGANVGFPSPDSPYRSNVTSYDYGALLTESGEYTEKYFATLGLLKSFRQGYHRPESILNINSSYFHDENVPVTKCMPFSKILGFADEFMLPNPVAMEELGQRFGFILYEQVFKEDGQLKFCLTRGARAVVLVNDVIVSVIMGSHGLQSVDIKHNPGKDLSTLWILVECLGRINFTEESEILNNERRGIIGPVMLNKTTLLNWVIYNLPFDKEFFYNISLSEWDDIDTVSEPYMGFYAAEIDLIDVEDTFLYSSSWDKGLVFINGFNIGRYWKVGPQQTLFVPKHFLKKGKNEIVAFELHNKIMDFQLIDFPILDVTKQIF